MPLTISQDGADPRVADAASSFVSQIAAERPDWKVHLATHAQAPAGPDTTPYHRLAAHYGDRLREAFAGGADRVIVVEDDMEFAPDFFSFMYTFSTVFDVDPTVWTVSAWNDNGQEANVADEGAVVRSDFFPGLGWMLPASVWADVGGRWPAAYWDDWLREPAQRRGRVTVRPEVCRTYTFGEAGTSNGEFFDQYLRPIRLARASRDWTQADVAAVAVAQYDATLAASLARATRAPAEQATATATAPVGGGDLCVEYFGLGDGPGEFVSVARQVGIMDNVKAGVPRAAYRGVVSVRRGERTVYVAPRGCQLA